MLNITQYRHVRPLDFRNFYEIIGTHWLKKKFRVYINRLQDYPCIVNKNIFFSDSFVCNIFFSLQKINKKHHKLVVQQKKVSKEEVFQYNVNVYKMFRLSN